MTVLNGALNYSFCLPDVGDDYANCPINEISFETPEGDGWQERKISGEVQNYEDVVGKRVYFRKDAMSNAIEQVRVSAERPCFVKLDQSHHPE